MLHRDDKKPLWVSFESALFPAPSKLTHRLDSKTDCAAIMMTSIVLNHVLDRQKTLLDAKDGSKTSLPMLHVVGSHAVPSVLLLVSRQGMCCCFVQDFLLTLHVDGSTEMSPVTLLVSACSVVFVQVENVECMPGDHIKFDFLGKDSIRYENEVVVHPKVYALIQKFCQHSANNKRKGPCTCTAI